MKKFLKLSLVALAAAFAFAEATPVEAQTSIRPQQYPLTNSLVGTTNFICITNGFLTLGTNGAYFFASQPFQIWRGRGFAFNSGLVGTNANNTGTSTFFFRFANVIYTNNVPKSTNWSTTLYSVTRTHSGTTEQIDWTNISPTAVDNVQLGQLYSYTNNSVNSVQLDPTNLYVSVYP